MVELNVIKGIAEKALEVPTVSGTADRYLIDRAFRVFRHCGSIAQLSEVQRFQLDRDCLNVAALFCDSGFSRYASQDDQMARMVLADLTNDDLRDFSCQVVHENLADVLNPRQLDRVCAIIMDSGKKETALIEAMILSDARNLDDLGAVGIFNELRRYVTHGRGISGAVVSWKRKIEYDYWKARLRESFRFDPVRELARRRLKFAEQFMEELDLENKAGDLEDFLLEQTLVPKVEEESFS